jgi:hypothetical protein
MGQAARDGSVPWCSVVGLLVLVGAAACGKASHGESDGEAAGASSTGGSGGSSAGMFSGSSGSGSAGMFAGSSGSGGSVPLPNATEEEQAILEPLFIDSAKIDGANMQQLIEMGADIGIARGYALCRCAAPGQPLPNLMACAVAEVGGLGFTRSPPRAPKPLLNQDLARCLQEKSVQLPWFADALRCELRWHQEDGRAWLARCSLPGVVDGDSATYPRTPPFECPSVDQAMREQFSTAIVLECRGLAYCDDGTRVPRPRCNGTRECPDWSDERSCFDIEGQDTVRCGDESVPPWRFCELSSCGDDGTEPPICDDSQRLHCPDGTELSVNSLCDRQDDCADGADERYCLR